MADQPSERKRVAIYIVARDAVTSLASVLDRIPESASDRVDDVFVFDSGSADDTYLVGVGYKAVSGRENLTVVRGERAPNGLLTKRAIHYCQERGYDILVLLHADGKYAPEAIEELIGPIERGEADAVVGTRLRDPAALRRAMPTLKRLVVRGLSALQRVVFPIRLEDYHCGYRAYLVAAIAELPFDENTDQLHFDTEILVQIGLKGLRVVEVPVPPYSGAESDGVAGWEYAANVLRSLVEYWLHTRGLREVPKFAIAEKYPYKLRAGTSHQRLLGLLDRGAQRVLDVGCGAGYLSEALRERGHEVVGVDVRRSPRAEARLETLIEVDLDQEPIPWTGERFQCVILADILEHLRDPERLLRQCRELLTDQGALLVSVPNVAHWSVRLTLLLGRFDYTARGILDRSHLRFYTLKSLTAELQRAGFEIERQETTTAPFDELLGGSGLAGVAGAFAWLGALGGRVWPELFGFQLVLRARPRRSDPNNE